jgi:hypothetical protein
VIQGLGEVRWVREYDRERPDGPHGMGIQFLQLSERSRQILERALALREDRGRADLDGRAPPRPPGTNAPAEVVSPGDAEPALGGDPARAASPEPAPATPGTPEPVLAEPAAAPGDTRATPPAPAAEPAQGRRSLRITDLLGDPASGVVDANGRRVADAVRRARELARELAGHADDDDLAALLDRDAVPHASVDQASRELAERVGGSPVVSGRYRSASEDDGPRAGSGEPPSPRSRSAGLGTVEAAAPHVTGTAGASGRAPTPGDPRGRAAGESSPREAGSTRVETEIPIDIDDADVLEQSELADEAEAARSAIAELAGGAPRAARKP